jgi:hypothetical protein
MGFGFRKMTREREGFSSVLSQINFFTQSGLLVGGIGLRRGGEGTASGRAREGARLGGVRECCLNAFGLWRRREEVAGKGRGRQQMMGSTL